MGQICQIRAGGDSERTDGVEVKPQSRTQRDRPFLLPLCFLLGHAFGVEKLTIHDHVPSPDQAVADRSIASSGRASLLGMLWESRPPSLGPFNRS